MSGQEELRNFLGGNPGMAERVLAVESDGSVYERRRPTRELEDFSPRKHSICGASTKATNLDNPLSSQNMEGESSEVSLSSLRVETRRVGVTAGFSCSDRRCITRSNEKG